MITDLPPEPNLISDNVQSQTFLSVGLEPQCSTMTGQTLCPSCGHPAVTDQRLHKDGIIKMLIAAGISWHV
jgi:hypothetical protein